MTKSCRYIVAWIAVSILAFPAYGADSLGDLREEARTPSPSSSSSSGGGGYCYDDDDCDEDYGLSEALGPVVGFVLFSPFWGPVEGLGDNYDITYRFPEYPHQYRQGYMISDAQSRGGKGEELCRLDLAVRVSGEYGTNLSGIDWIGGRFLLESSARLGLDADFRLMEEHLRPGMTDSLWLGDMNAFFRFAESRRCAFRAGIGFNWLSDAIEDDYGMNFTYAFDWFPRKPVVISAEMDLGWLGDAGLFHGRITSGVNYRNAEAFVGYDYYRIGEFDLNGLVAGVRLWW